MAFADDVSPRIVATMHTVGQDLAILSVEELQERIDTLHTEIERLEAEMARKAATRSAANALFNP